jgi:hypothetical protein
MEKKFLKIILLNIFFLCGCCTIKAQVQLSGQKTITGVSVSDSAGDPSIPHLSAVKMSGPIAVNTVEIPADKNSTEKKDSIPAPNTGKMPDPARNPKD